MTRQNNDQWHLDPYTGSVIISTKNFCLKRLMTHPEVACWRTSNVDSDHDYEQVAQNQTSTEP